MRALTSLALVALCLAAPLEAAAYKRSKVPGTDISLYWCVRQIPFVVNEKGSHDAGAAASIAAVQVSFKAWEGPTCTDLKFNDQGTTPRTDVGFDQTSSDNINVVLWREKTCATAAPKGDTCFVKGGCNNLYDCWEAGPATIAITTTTFNNKTGEIYDADIELNGAGYVFTADDGPATCPNPPVRPSVGCIATDVRNTATHEIGHVVGLDHVTLPNATMYPSAPLGETSKRTLHDDDIAGECAIYPKGQITAECVNRPDVGTGGCGCGTDSGRAASMAWLVPAGLALLALGWMRPTRRFLTRRSAR